MWGAAVFSLIGLAFLVAESSGLSVELAPGQLSCLVHEAVRVRWTRSGVCTSRVVPITFLSYSKRPQQISTYQRGSD